MEPLSGDFATQPSLSSSSALPVAGSLPLPRRRLRVAPLRQPAPAQPPPPQPKNGARVRLSLQHRAPTNLRHHLLRATLRFTVLVVGDLASFGVMRALMRALREHAVVGPAIAAEVRALLPPGILDGWQFAAALFMGLIVTGNYGPGDARRNARGLFFACALATALPLWMTIWTQGLEPMLVQYALTTVLVWGGLTVERWTIDGLLGQVLPPWQRAAATVFVGPAEECRETIKSAAFAAGGEYRPIGFVDTHIPPAADALGHVADLATVLHERGGEVVVVSGYLPDSRFRGIVDAALVAECQLLSVPRAIAIAGVQPQLVWRRQQALIELTRPTLKGWQLMLKRAVDIVGATLGLVVLSPVLALVALAVRVESRGHAIFGHRRLGLNGGGFRCYKFRSMHADAENRLRSDPVLYAEYVANSFKLPEDRDPRLTPVGRFLRRTSLDELPQLVNVLKGEMSLVGPRPIVPEELDEYGHGADVFLSLKPGITGAWQINGRSRVGYPDRADMELEYVRNWSLGRDLWILLKTAPAVLARRGAH